MSSTHYRYRNHAAHKYDQGPVFEIFSHTPKNEWKRHGIPVEIRFSENDKRESSVGALFLDIPNEPLRYPSYALFIDSGNALILQTCPRRLTPEGVSQNIRLMTSEDVQRQSKNQFFSALANTVRIGIASFV